MGIKLKFNKFILVSLFLLAILTIGAVSAENQSNDAFTAETSAETVDTPISDAGEDDSSSEDVDLIGGSGSEECDHNISVAGEYHANIQDDCPIIYLELPSDANGNITVYIDEMEVYSSEEGNIPYELYASDLDLSDYCFDGETYDIGIKYSGDSRYKGFYETYQLNYTFKMSLYLPEEVWYGNSAIITVEIVDVYDEDVFLYVNGKKYTETFDWNGQAIFNITGLKYGINEIKAEYPGGGDYSAKTLSPTYINVTSKVDVKKYFSYVESGFASIKLPEDATGNFIIIIDGTEYYNAPILNGVANISISGMTIGKHMINVTYTGEDYPVEDYNDSFMVAPIVNIPTKVHADDDFEITFEVPNDLTGKMYCLLKDSPSPQVTFKESIVDGHATLTISGYEEYKNYDDEIATLEVFLYYIDGSKMIWGHEDSIKIYDVSPDTVINVSIDKSYFKPDGSGEVVVYYDDLATGAIDVYIDGVYKNTVELYGGYYSSTLYYDVDLDGLEYGNHTFEIKYSGDDYFKPLNRSFVFEVSYMKVYLPHEIEIREYADEIEVEFVEDATGFIVVYIDGEEYATKFVNDYIYVPLENLKQGNHTYKVVYSGDENYKPTSQNGSFVITNYMMYADVPYWVLDYGEIPTVRVYLPEIAKGNVSLIFEDKTYTEEVKGGIASFNITGITGVGTYYFKVRFNGDDNCKPFTSEDCYSIDWDYSIHVKDSVGVGEIPYVSLKLPEDANGNLTIDIDDGDRIITAPLVNGFANLTVPDLEYGLEYYFKAYYTGEDYSVQEYIGDFLLEAEIEHPDNNYLKISGEDYISLKLPGDADGKLLIYNYGEDDEGEPILISYHEVPLVNGKAKFLLNEFGLGDYWVDVSYSGDDYYVADLYHEYFKINPDNVTFPNVIVAGDDEYIEVALPEDAKGKLSAEFYIDDPIIVSAVNGRIPLKSLPSGSYEVYIYYKGDDYGEYFGYAGHIKVLKVVPEMAVNVSRANEGIKVTLPSDATGKVIISAKSEKYLVDVVNGVAIAKIPNLEPGELNVSAIYSGDEKYNGADINATLNVPTIVAKDTKLVITTVTGKYQVIGVLKDIDGNIIPEGAVISYTINDGEKLNVSERAHHRKGAE